MKFTFVLILFMWGWPWHHKPKPHPAPPRNYFCEPDFNSEDGKYEVIPCAPIDNCADPYDTDVQRCILII